MTNSFFKKLILLQLLTLCHILLIQAHEKPVEPKRELKVMSSWLNKPCNYSVYKTLFFEQLLNKNDSLIPLLTEGNFTLDAKNGSTLYFGDYLNELCISIDENKVVDINTLDCLPGPYVGWVRRKENKGRCTCGKTMDTIDLNVPQPESSPVSQKNFLQTVGLNRKLINENGECVSGLKGHCNLNLKLPLKCFSGLTCSDFVIEDAINGHRAFKNQNTKAVYGICTHQQSIARNSTTSFEFTRSVDSNGMGGVIGPSHFVVFLFFILSKMILNVWYLIE